MSNPVIVRYQLDPTGISPNNLVQGEPHTLANRLVRTLVPTYGAYFANSMVIVDQATQLPLIRGQQWYPGELYDVPTAKFGQDIYALVVITDQTVSDNVVIQYQAIGGEYGDVDTAILQVANNLSLDTRPVTWPNIIHKPEEFPPSMHLHDIGDVYGFEYMVHALERIRAAIEFGDQVSHDQIYKYIDNVVRGLTQYALVNGSPNNTFNVAMAIAATDATPLAQVNALIAAATSVITNGVVGSINGLIGNLNIASGAGISITYPDPHSIMVSASGGNGGGTTNRNEWTGTPGVTDFPFNYVVGFLDVYKNGVKLPGSDFTATSGTNFTLNVPTTTTDIIFANCVTAAAGATGPQGPAGADGINGADGTSGVLTLNGKNGTLNITSGNGLLITYPNANTIDISLPGHGSRVYNTPGTYTLTVPAGVTSMSMSGIGGGGGASGGYGNKYNGDPLPLRAGKVGVAGTYGTANHNVTPGQVLTIVVGAGGAGGVFDWLGTSRTDGGAGAASTINGTGVAVNFGGGAGGVGVNPATPAVQAFAAPSDVAVTPYGKGGDTGPVANTWYFANSLPGINGEVIISW